MLKTADLKFAYPGQPPMQFPDIRCERGSHWLLLGQSGTGKTTLLHLLAGLRTPQAGSVEIGETDIARMPRARLDTFRGRNIGIIFQQPHFVRSLNVSENLALTQKLSGMKVDHHRIAALLDRLGIAHKAKDKTHRLSQGEQQRVAIARALVNDPVVILADEPTSALDDVHTDAVIELLEEQATAANATLLVVTHDGRLRSHFKNQISL